MHFGINSPILDNFQRLIEEVEGTSVPSSSQSLITFSSVSDTNLNRQNLIVLMSELSSRNERQLVNIPENYEPGPRKRPVRSVVRVKDISSEIHPDHIEQYRSCFEWMNDVEILLPNQSDRVTRPPQGYFSIYLHHVDSGFHYPLSPGLADLLSALDLCPAQLHPNAWADLIAEHWLFENLDISLDGPLGRLLLTPTHKGQEDFIYFTKNKLWHSFLKRTSSVHNFKEFFFFIRINPDAPSFPIEWKPMINQRHRGPIASEGDIRLKKVRFVLVERWTYGEAVHAFIYRIPLAYKDQQTRTIMYKPGGFLVNQGINFLFSSFPAFLSQS